MAPTDNVKHEIFIVRWRLFRRSGATVGANPNAFLDWGFGENALTCKYAQQLLLMEEHTSMHVKWEKKYYVNINLLYSSSAE